MTVSIIVPSYKAEQWIDQCLDSIKAQTYRGIETIVINDKQGIGAAAARNRGLDKVSGEFVTFCDADDYMEPEAIEKMVAAMDGVDMVCGSFRKFGTFEMVVSHPTEKLTIKQVASYAMQNLLQPMTHQMLSGCWAKMYRRSLVERFPLITTAEDMGFNFDYLTRCKSLRFVSDVVYHNRKRQGSLSTTFEEKNKNGLFGFLRGLAFVRRFMEKHYTREELEMALDGSKIYHSMLYFMRICEQQQKPMREVLKSLYQ